MMGIGGGLRGQGGSVLLYRSTDLCRREYLQPSLPAQHKLRRAPVRSKWKGPRACAAGLEIILVDG